VAGDYSTVKDKLSEPLNLRPVHERGFQKERRDENSQKRGGRSGSPLSYLIEVDGGKAGSEDGTSKTVKYAENGGGEKRTGETQRPATKKKLQSSWRAD